MEALGTDKHLKMITNIIEFLRLQEARSSCAVYMEIDDLILTPELEVDLNCVGLAGYQVKDGCLISWRDDIESAKNCYSAEEEYYNLKKSGPQASEGY